ncbi:MAG: energy transducer TonB [Chryseobacterium sp.]|uniref:energy transducer TonB n=1 Tax=Chryseobacterium sp. TaxID=1871047 RepID=UPI0025BDABB4|nr:energy transducer TonB [Chryseobacterium sp.]MCJ7932716.1 energy transducer TonB [Chryseobacterium sp.]
MKYQNQNQEFRFNEVLFEHRNKEYGAYALRNESDKILTKALFVGVSLLAAVSITPFVISAFKVEAPSKTPEGVVIDFTPVIPDEPVTPPVKIEPVKPVSPPDVKTYDSTVPTPSRNAPDNVQKDPIPDDAVAGLDTNLKGKPVNSDSYVPAPPSVGTGPVIHTAPPAVPQPVDKNKIETELSVEASFTGGIDSFRNKVMNNFDGSGFESEDVVKTTVTFIVEMDGTISGVKANGTNADFNSEAMRTIKNISSKGKWIPAKNKKGENVRSYFKFPISMRFE